MARRAGDGRLNVAGGPVVLGWARSAVCPRGGALAALAPHEIGAPVVRALLARSGLAAADVSALLCGNALGAGGNPARMVALAAGLPDKVPALSVDSQCCAGLDAVTLGAALLASGQAELVVAGGVEAWSRAPIRQHRPREAGAPAVAYERPAFAPEPARDPEPPQAAARLAARHGVTRAAQDAWAIDSHARALAGRARMADEIVPIGAAAHDAYARALTAARAARMPVEAVEAAAAACAVSRLAIAPQADGAAFVALASADAAARLGCRPRLRWLGGVSVGGAPEWPTQGALDATQALLARHGLGAGALWGVELHEAFAVQAIVFADALGLPRERLGRGGGGLGRGHPIGASGAVSLVRLLADMDREAPPGALGLATIAAAGGLGAAVLVERL